MRANSGSGKTWELDPGHNLVYRERGSVQTLSGDIIAAGPDSLAFKISSRDTAGNDHLRVLELSGSWRAGDDSRLFFQVNDNKETGILAFRNDWKLSRNQEIAYTYERAPTRRRQVFRLTGHWELNSLERITYVIGNGPRAVEFRCQLESFSLQPKKGAVKFRVGGGVSGSGRSVLIFGSWRFSRALAIDFQAGENGAISFATQLIAGSGNTVRLAITDERRKPVGVELELSRRLLGGDAFLRLKKQGIDRGIEAGVKIPF